jgi:transcriptional regulator with XRE-family HTH domain
MTREELIQTKEYWMAKLQIDLFNEVEDYMKRNGLNRVKFAEKLGVSKGYISQVLNGDADHRMSKFVELALAIGLIPNLSFEKMEDIVNREKSGATHISGLDIERSKDVLLQSGYLFSHKPVSHCSSVNDVSDDNQHWKKLGSIPEFNKENHLLVS